MASLSPPLPPGCVSRSILASGAECERLPPDWPDRRSGGQPHALEERAPPGIAVQRPERRLGLHLGESSIPLLVGALQPFERGVDLTPRGMDFRDLVGAAFRVLPDELPQPGVRFLAAALDVQDDRGGTEPEHLLRLALRLHQRLLRPP